MRRRMAIAGAIFATLLFGGAGPVGAGPILPDFDYSPTSGPPGTVISASGNCDAVIPPAAQGAPDAPTGLAGTVTLELSEPGGPVLDSVTEDMASNGDWSAEVTVPTGTPDGDYDLDASCTFGFVEGSKTSSVSDGAPDSPAGQGFTGFYATQLFSVTAQATTTTVAPSSTAGPTSTTTAPAVAAQAQRVQPSFTG